MLELQGTQASLQGTHTSIPGQVLLPSWLPSFITRHDPPVVSTRVKPLQRTKSHSTVRIFRAYATGSEMLPKEFPEMFEKLQQIGVNIWFPGGTTWMGSLLLWVDKSVSSLTLSEPSV